MKDDRISQNPPRLEATGQPIQQTQYSKYHWDQIEWVIPVVENNTSVVNVTTKSLNLSQVLKVQHYSAALAYRISPDVVSRTSKLVSQDYIETSLVPRPSSLTYRTGGREEKEERKAWERGYIETP